MKLSLKLFLSFFILLNLTALDCQAQTKPTAANTARTNAQPGLRLEPCRLTGLDVDVRCGKLEVFENRETKAGRKISLNIVLYPSMSAKPAPDPVFFIAGGPGQSAVDVLKTAGADYLAGLRRERDIIFVDQRGTGGSNLLDCRLSGDKDDMRRYFGDPFSPDVLKACRERLERTADLTLYTTPIAMDDLDDVRASLGYDKINLFGGSYGTMAALVYLRQHETHVRAVVIKGVAPPDFKLPLGFAKGVQHAMDRLFEDCAADAVCAKTYPNFKQEFLEVLARLDKGPVSFEVTNPVTKQPQQISLSRAAFVDYLRVLLYVPDVVALFPTLIHQAHEGNFVSFATVSFIIYRQIDAVLARGMQFSVTCPEDLAFITEDDIKRETAGTYYGDARVRANIKACEMWPKARVPASFLDPVRSNVPVLMISGEVDPVTPPWFAQAAAKYLPNSLHLINHNGTHLSNSDCIDNLIAAFISKGSAQGLDTSCVKNLKRPPFYTGAQQ